MADEIPAREQLLIITEEESDVPEGYWDAIDSLKPSRRLSGMADEIHNANVITLHRELSDAEFGLPHWVARIGPAGQGVSAVGTNEIEALIALTMSLHLDRWPFDQTWKPAAATSDPGPKPGPMPPKPAPQ